MSIRVATVRFTGNPGLMGETIGGETLPFTLRTPIGLPPDGRSWFDEFPFIEAAPFYLGIEIRLRIAGGDDDGFDETVTFTRVPMLHNDGGGFAPITSLYQGIFGFDVGNGGGGLAVDGDTIAYVGAETYGEISPDYGPNWADPKKQRIWFPQAFREFITRGGYGLIYMRPPGWFPASASGERSYPTQWGYGTAAGEYEDASAWSDTKWRDYRGTYSAIVSSGHYAFGGVATYDWTLS